MRRLDPRASAAVFAVGLALLTTACSGPAPATSWQGSPAPGSAAGASPSQSPTPTGRPVHVRLYERDGSTYGVGMPIIAYISARITDAKAFVAATKVTVNGTAADGAWFFEKSAIYKGYPLEAHYRLSDYWPAHAAIRMDLPIKGQSAGPDLVFDNSLTLDMSTGAANISRIDGRTERMVVTSDGKQVFNFPVSLGKASTPTFGGVKVVMEKHRVQRMTGPGYDLQVPFSVRVTNSGEFIHAASWNGGNIGQRSTSHGCTNLNESDAQHFFAFANIGDVAVYTNTGGPTMPSWDGYGDWNLPWSTWQSGGQVHTS
ncbi:MAG: L,D-transpeptidase [Micromonosporaceae bacterium]|nr:L,D-transpeptidase [Micromonosporaceae bacterium]